jgi:hypothetical protein
MTTKGFAFVYLLLMGGSGSAQDTRTPTATIDPVDDAQVKLTLVQEGRTLKLYRGGIYRVNEQFGRWIAFASASSGNMEIWAMGGDQQRLFAFAYGAGRLPWQPAPVADVAKSYESCFLFPLWGGAPRSRSASRSLSTAKRLGEWMPSSNGTTASTESSAPVSPPTAGRAAGGR